MSDRFEEWWESERRRRRAIREGERICAECRDRAQLRACTTALALFAAFCGFFGPAVSMMWFVDAVLLAVLQVHRVHQALELERMVEELKKQ